MLYRWIFRNYHFATTADSFLGIRPQPCCLHPFPQAHPSAHSACTEAVAPYTASHAWSLTLPALSQLPGDLLRARAYASSARGGAPSIGDAGKPRMPARQSSCNPAAKPFLLRRAPLHPAVLPRRKPKCCSPGDTHQPSLWAHGSPFPHRISSHLSTLTAEPWPCPSPKEPSPTRACDHMQPARASHRNP